LSDGHNGGTRGTYAYRHYLAAGTVAGTTPADSKRCHQTGKSAQDPTNAAEHEYCFLAFQNDGLFIYTLRKYKASSF
jgi:hypothetical protein